MREKAKIQSWWQNEAGVEHIPINKMNGKTFIKIQSNLLKAKVINQKVLIIVDRSLIRRPAWNPLESTKKIIDMASQGVRPPKIYPAVLGTDGNFYLLDGNHRFQIDTRQKVLIELSYQLKTVEWRGMLDLVGVTQPSENEIMGLYNGKISPEELSPKALFRNDF